MKAMTSRERLSNVLNGSKADRTPVSIFVTDTDIEDGPPNVVLDKRSDDVIDDLIAFHEVLGIDIILRISVPVFEPVGFDVNSDGWLNSWEYSDDRKSLVHTITTPDGQLREVFGLEGEDFHGDPSTEWMKLRNVRTEALIKGLDDMAIVKKHRPAIGLYDFGHIKRITEKLGDRGIVAPRAGSSVFNSAFGLRKLEELFMDPIINPDLYKELMELCTEDVIKVGKQVVRAGGQLQRVIGNIANAGMVSSGFYREHVMGYEKRYIDALTESGCKVLFHNCGQCSGLLEVYGDMLAGQALESFSTGGSGGDIESLADARKRLGDGVVMVGNFDQVQLLRNGTRQEIRQRVHEIFEETKGDEKFIFSTSDSIIPGTPKKNIVAMAEAALECAG